MSMQAPIPSPVGPFAIETLDGTTDSLDAVATATELDALPLLDYRLRAQTLPPAHGIRGAHLVLRDGNETRLLRVDRNITHLGRDAAADVRFEDHRVSRDHAILVRHGRYFRLLDNRSANGTFVNGHCVSATNLASGDVIELGPVRLEFVEID